MVQPKFGYYKRAFIYGLKQAARVWNQVIHKVFIEGGFEANNEDPCLYILIFVDDIAVVCKPEDMLYVERILSADFEIENLGIWDGNFEICQSGYIKKIASIFRLENAKSVGTPLSVSYYRNQNERKELLSDSTLTVLGNKYETGHCSKCKYFEPTSIKSEDDWIQLKNIVRYLMGSVNMKLSNVHGENENQNLVGYADAIHANRTVVKFSS